jgi:EmrB/QacA subfamily drug resistance transporter
LAASVFSEFQLPTLTAFYTRVFGKSINLKENFSASFPIRASSFHLKTNSCYDRRMQRESTEPISKTAKRAALIVATFGSFMTPFDGSVVTLALPSIGKDLGGNVVSLGWVATAYVLGLTICVVPFGRLADIRGRGRIYVIGVGLFTLASALCGLAPSLNSLIAMRIVQGVAAAMMAGNSIALLTSVFPASERGKVLGINTGTVYIGLSVGPSLGGFLVQHLGWRSAFFVNVPIGIGVVLLALFKLQRETLEAKNEKLDPIGIVTYGLALCMIVLGLTFSEGQVSTLSATLVVCGLGALAVFIFYERQIPSPLLDLRLFSNTTFAFSTLTALLNYSSVFGVSFILSLYLQLVPGFSVSEAGLIMLVQPVLMATFSPFGGWLSDRVEPRIVSSVAMSIVAAAVFSMSLLGAASQWWEVAVRLMALGVGYAFFSSPNTNAAMSSVERGQYGIAAAIMSTMRFTGQAISLAVATSVLSANLGGIAVSGRPSLKVPADAFMKGMRSALIILASICAVGIFTSLVRGRIRSETSAKL